jgi:integrase/recombinase XerD
MMNVLGARVVGPLEPYAAGFAEHLARLGYTLVTRRQYMTLVAHLSRWLACEGLGAGALTADVGRRYVQARAAAGYHAFHSPRSLDVLLIYLRAVGVAPAEPPVVLSAVDSVVERFRAHLLAERGLRPNVAEFYVASVRPFVSTMVVGDAVDAESLSARTVIGSCPTCRARRRPRPCRDGRRRCGRSCGSGSWTA